MKLKNCTLGLLASVVATAAIANTPLLFNVSFDSPTTQTGVAKDINDPNTVLTDPWIASANTWADIGKTQYSYWTQLGVADQVVPSGDGFVFSSWDADETQSAFETFVVQEYKAGPPGGFENTTFSTGDVIVFKGEASATITGANTSDVIVRAFIKVLGYTNNLAYQTKLEYSDFHPIGSNLEPFNLSVVFPDLTVDDSLQMLQIGFEASTRWDPTAGSMDTASIFFKNIEAYIEGSSWQGYDLDENGFTDTGDWMGWVMAANAPWVYNMDLGGWTYIPDEAISDSGAWVYVPR